MYGALIRIVQQARHRRRIVNLRGRQTIPRISNVILIVPYWREQVRIYGNVSPEVRSLGFLGLLRRHTGSNLMMVVFLLLLRRSQWMAVGFLVCDSHAALMLLLFLQALLIFLVMRYVAFNGVIIMVYLFTRTVIFLGIGAKVRLWTFVRI